MDPHFKGLELGWPLWPPVRRTGSHSQRAGFGARPSTNLGRIHEWLLPPGGGHHAADTPSERRWIRVFVYESWTAVVDGSYQVQATTPTRHVRSGLTDVAPAACEGQIDERGPYQVSY
jgi:hypothetical protein